MNARSFISWQIRQGSMLISHLEKILCVVFEAVVMLFSSLNWSMYCLKGGIRREEEIGENFTTLIQGLFGLKLDQFLVSLKFSLASIHPEPSNLSDSGVTLWSGFIYLLWERAIGSLVVLSSFYRQWRGRFICENSDFSSQPKEVVVNVPRSF